MNLFFNPPGCISREEIEENLRASYWRHKAGMPYASGSGRLALVGGGPSASEHIGELRNWPGQVWAVNGAAQWCREHGIDAALVTCHPTIEAPPASVCRAVLGPECSPLLFDALAGREISLLAEYDHDPNKPIDRGCSTATAVALASLAMGFDGITLFGCEGSYGETSHNYDVPQRADDGWMRVLVNGTEFRTKAEFLLQSQILANLIRIAPDKIEQRCGGLLHAMTEDFGVGIIEMDPEMGLTSMVQ